jgi:hypothetical protein
MSKKSKRKSKEETSMPENTETVDPNAVAELATEETQEVPTKGKKAKRLKKDLATDPGKLIIEVIGGSLGARTFDPSTLPENVKDQLPAFALSHKLGDAAAGKSGIEAEEAITKVWEGLVAGDWSVRAPAQPKVAVSAVIENFKNLSDKEKATAKVLLETLGIPVPE